jgi:hypothetical protein
MWILIWRSPKYIIYNSKEYSTLSQKRLPISLLIKKRKSIHPMAGNVSFHRMNAFYISLLTMKSSIAFGTVYGLISFTFENLLYYNNMRQWIFSSKHSGSVSCKLETHRKYGCRRVCDATSSVLYDIFSF